MKIIQLDKLWQQWRETLVNAKTTHDASLQFMKENRMDEKASRAAIRLAYKCNRKI